VRLSPQRAAVGSQLVTREEMFGRPVSVPAACRVVVVGLDAPINAETDSTTYM